MNNPVHIDLRCKRDKNYITDKINKGEVQKIALSL